MGSYDEGRLLPHRKKPPPNIAGKKNYKADKIAKVFGEVCHGFLHHRSNSSYKR